MNGREGWAPFSYLEPKNAVNGRAGVNSGPRENKDTLGVVELQPSKYSEYVAAVYFCDTLLEAMSKYGILQCSMTV